jgi:glycerol-3-phosphate acyltransferase PlsX
MKIVVDAMGGDKDIPDINIEGALHSIKEVENLEIILVGPKKIIEERLDFLSKKFFLKKYFKNLMIINAEEVVSMEDQPSKVLRTKQNSSIAVGIKLLKDNLADGFVSAGNSGVIMAFALTQLGTVKNVSRPAIAAVLPTLNSSCVVLDVGANVDCKPSQLVELAYIGSIYSEYMLGKKEPKVALLSIGSEDTKGNQQVLEAYKILKQTKLNFIGNIEGKDIPFGVTDVVITDGFVGNIILKFGEGVSEMLLSLIKQALKKHPFAMLSLPFVWNAIRDIRKKVDFTEYGGAPLLGLEKVCIISHGRSNAKAIKNAIKVATQMVEKKVNLIISEYMEKIVI